MSKSSLHIISHSFPTIEAPYNATFVSDHAVALSNNFDIRLSVPTPRSFPLTNRYKKNHSPLILPEKIQGYRCYYLSLPKKRFPAFISRSLSRNLSSFLERQPVDLIHIHFLYPSGMVISDLKKEINCPIVLTIHGVDFYHTYQKPGLKKILKANLEQADAIISVGPGLERDIIDEYPYLENKISCIQNFVDTHVFKPVNQAKKMELRQELNIDPLADQLLCVANFRYKKGIDTLVDALTLLDDQDLPNLHLIGRLHEEPDFQAVVKKKIKASGLTNVFIHGPKPRDEIKKWMLAMDGFVLPSRNEPFGIALIEAMACGVPVVSTRSGGPEVILSDKWGFLVDPENPQQLAEAIYKLTQIDTFDASGQHKYIEENFGLKRYRQEYTELYDQLLIR